ncbi:hypothetical protein ANCDUO_22792 [Ancylostoma duodenale]|uniref:SAC domain-containing protein n=1 Tax=Ancylostoma duodenale TaxID=51022 RepID=A0A0C2CBC2_9BILA|nr:hypothetical protein ANCDUO_22792 [Ancylostoma duodenale]
MKTIKRFKYITRGSVDIARNPTARQMLGRLRRVTVYETAGRFYLVGCDTSGTRFKVLKIDRIDSKALLTGEPECDYSKDEILELLATITEGSSVVYRSSASMNGKSGRKGSPGLIERISNAFGLLGVVRFLEGYYLIVVTKANIIASFGYHSIYKIAEVAMISLAMDGLSTSAEEQRYVKIFQSVDLSTDFYFSYTYDLSRSLQENVLSADWNNDGLRLLSADQKPHILSSARDRLDEKEIVKRRGSVPLRWSQDPATRGVVGKPLILVDIHEPHAQTAAAHFRDLRAKYGNPIIVMNLVKRREKRRHESLLHDQFLKAVKYLNQFLPPSEHIAYMSFDVARCNKASNVTSNVLTKMEEIAFKAVQAHGWFQSFPMPYTRSMDHRSALSDFKPVFSGDGRFLLQHGISRTNCVDCLDRTNVAQFGIGRVALACQLYAMGVLDYPCLSLHSDLCRAFEDIFDDHGDTMAWQYAGSQLERSRDVIQTLSRYYSNTFGDYDKQAAINLFLGVFRPHITSSIALWDLGTDYYLHFPTYMKVNTDYCAWMYSEEELNKIVELATEATEEPVPEQEQQEAKTRCDSLALRISLRLSCSDDFRDFYRTFEMSTLENRVKAQIIADARALSLHGINQEGSSSGQFMKLFKSDSKEKPKKGRSGEDDDDEDDDALEEEQAGDEVVEYEPAWIRLTNGSANEEKRTLKYTASLGNDGQERPILAAGLQFAKDIYGLGKIGPSPETRAFYENYVNSGGYNFNTEDWINHKPTLLTDLNIPTPTQGVNARPTIFTTDDVFMTCLPEVSKSSLKFYQKSFVTIDDYFSKVDDPAFTAYPSVF